MLPFEITSEILSRVPAETILDCKSVSKPWRNVVQHRSFSQKHLDRLNELDSDDSSGNLSLILYTKWSGEEELEPFYYTEYDEHLNRFTRTTRINVRPPFEKYDILHSCNGLICFNAFCENNYLQPAYTIYYPQPAYICNPITREYIVLPKIEGKSLLSGFGYSPKTNEYKVVRICSSRKDPNCGIVQVYTLGSGIGWRNGRKLDYDVISLSLSPRGVFVNGAIHWLDNFRGTVVAFDLADEEFRKLPSLPHTLGGVELRALRGFLCACFHNAQMSDIWILKKNKNNSDVIWSKEFSNINGELITFTKTGGLLCYAHREKNVYWYAPKASSSRILVNVGKDFNFGVLHKNTLVSLKALGEEDTKLMASNERARSSGERESSDHSSFFLKHSDHSSQWKRRKKTISEWL